MLQRSVIQYVTPALPCGEDAEMRGRPNGKAISTSRICSTVLGRPYLALQGTGHPNKRIHIPIMRNSSCIVTSNSTCLGRSSRYLTDSITWIDRVRWPHRMLVLPSSFVRPSKTPEQQFVLRTRKVPLRYPSVSYHASLYDLSSRPRKEKHTALHSLESHPRSSVRFTTLAIRLSQRATSPRAAPSGDAVLHFCQNVSCDDC
jgi:hypothetical protein